MTPGFFAVSHFDLFRHLFSPGKLVRTSRVLGSLVMAPVPVGRDGSQACRACVGADLSAGGPSPHQLSAPPPSLHR